MNRLRILIVSDEQRLLDALVEGVRLRWPSADTLTATDSDVALAMAAQHIPDVLLLDVSTSAAQRWWLLARIRRVSRARVVVFASRGQAMNARRAADLDAWVFSSPRFSLHSLLALVDEAARSGRPTSWAHSVWRDWGARSAAALVTLLALATLLAAAVAPEVSSVQVQRLCAMAPDEVSDEFERLGVCPVEDDGDSSPVPQV